jgi:hypothetical protein
MSCWRNFTCNVLKNVDKDIAKKAFAEMGLSLDEKVKSVATSYFGGSESNAGNVDAAFVKNGKQIQLGVVWNGEEDKLQIVGDFWNTGIDDRSFIGTLSQIYQKINIQTQLELNGYTIDSVETNAKGEVEIEAYAWA